ncbi:MAG TPA: hypothetical protein VM009_00035 [Terriglobales bacterium]|nr:hypothetical protein [Terriglobales bacterium]
MRIVIGVLAVALGWTSYTVYFMHLPAGQEVTTLERKVSAQTLTSADTPRAKLTFDPAFTYVGGQRFYFMALPVGSSTSLSRPTPRNV